MAVFHMVSKTNDKLSGFDYQRGFRDVGWNLNSWGLPKFNW